MYIASILMLLMKQTPIQDSIILNLKFCVSGQFFVVLDRVSPLPFNIE